MHIKPMTKLFNLGTQGPDIFFYYLPGFITKRIRGVGTQMHEKNLGLFFMQLADIIKASHSPSQRKIIFAYTAGFLAHYAVDVHTHSYVFAHTHEPPHPRLEEATRHRHFETVVDVLMLGHMYNKKPGDLKLGQLITPEGLHKRTAAAAASTAIRNIYNLNIHPWDVYRAMGQMASFAGLLQSQTGKRKYLLGSAEAMTVGSKIISALIHMQSVSDGRDYLNIENSPWSAPWAPEATRRESFLELFEAAVAEAVQMIQALHAYTKNSLSKDQLAAIIMNRSLKTGTNP